MTPREVTRATKSFVPPVELTGSRPRDVQLTASGRIVNALAMAMMAGAIVVAFLLSQVSARESAERDAFNRESVGAAAEVTRLWRDSSGENKKNWVAYTFTVDGGPVEGRAKVGSSRFKSLRVGSSIDVRYLPSDPTSSVLAGSGPKVLPPAIPFVVAGLMVAVGLLMLRGINCQRTLLADGRPAAAVVTDIVKHHSSHGGTHRSMKYTFPLLSGATAKGKAGASKKAEIGSVICIVYDPDRPRRNRRYPFELVKTARL